MPNLTLSSESARAPDRIDFTAYPDPVLAVPCPLCRCGTGAWCVRSDGTRTAKLHAIRAAAADIIFLEQHGPAATIDLVYDDGWVIDPRGRARD